MGVDDRAGLLEIDSGRAPPSAPVLGDCAGQEPRLLGRRWEDVPDVERQGVANRVGDWLPDHLPARDRLLDLPGLCDRKLGGGDEEGLELDRVRARGAVDLRMLPVGRPALPEVEDDLGLEHRLQAAIPVPEVQELGAELLVRPEAGLLRSTQPDVNPLVLARLGFCAYLVDEAQQAFAKVLHLDGLLVDELLPAPVERRVLLESVPVRLPELVDLGSGRGDVGL